MAVRVVLAAAVLLLGSGQVGVPREPARDCCVAAPRLVHAGAVPERNLLDDGVARAVRRAAAAKRAPLTDRDLLSLYLLVSLRGGQPNKP